MSRPASPAPQAILVASASLLVLTSSSCSTLGATLPPGAANGTFLDEARGIVPMGAVARDRQRALDEAERAHVEANVEVFRVLREDARRLRADLRKAAADLVAEDGRDFINRSDLRRVRDLAQRYLEVDALLYGLWSTYRDHLPYRSEPDPYAPMRAATLLTPDTREVGGLLALAAELERLDTASAVVETLRPHHALTRFLNRGDAVLELAPESFDRCIGALHDPDRRDLVARQLRAWQAERERLLARAEHDGRTLLLLETIQESASARALLTEEAGARRMAFLWTVLERSALNTAGPLFDAVISSGFIEIRDDEAQGTGAAPAPSAPAPAPSPASGEAPSEAPMEAPAAAPVETSVEASAPTPVAPKGSAPPPP